eukprot:gene12263-14373_t
MEPMESRNIYLNAADTDGLPDGSNAFRINIDDLEFGPEIGKGAYGRIFKGEYFGTPVGIKEISLSPNNSQYKDLVKFIQREVAMLRFSHPNLVQFIGVSERGQNLYIVTEFVSGGDLAYYLFKNKNDENPDTFMNRKVNIGSSSTPDLDTSSERLINLSWPLRIKIAYDVACAMAYLHSRHVIHRDLKSTNLLVCESWKIKVCDFGFARTAYTGFSGRAKRTMTICGTNNWMAPTTSQLRPCSLKYGLDVDVLLPLVPKDCPPPFLKLVLDCTEYDPDQRPTFKEITERLKSLTRRLAVPTIFPPLRVLAPSPLSSPLASPHIYNACDVRETPSPLSICEDSDSDDSDSDSDLSDCSDDDESVHSSKTYRSKSNNNHTSSSKHSSSSKHNKGYIVRHFSADSEQPSSLPFSPSRLSPVSFSPPTPSSSSSSSPSSTSKSPTTPSATPSFSFLNNDDKEIEDVLSNNLHSIWTPVEMPPMGSSPSKMLSSSPNKALMGTNRTVYVPAARAVTS